LRAKYAEKPRISVFYQVWEQPLMTVNGRHFISDAIQLCGGNNVFSELQTLAPTVSKESVIATNPQAIISGRTPGNDSSLQSEWGGWQSMDAVKYDNLFTIPSDLIARPTPRILDGLAMICEALDEARRHMHAR
jgi:iron complex transport system substrate-binding protein